MTGSLRTLDLLILSALTALLGYLFYPILRDIAMTCWTDDDYSHGLLLPIVAVYMIWDKRIALQERFTVATERIRREGRDGGKILATLLLLSGLFIYFLGEASGLSYASWLSFFPVTVGVLYLSFGRTFGLAIAPAVLILFMAKPLPDSLVVRIFWPLQVLAARVSTWTLELLNVPVYLSGNIIEIPAMRLMVEEACSGMRSVMALLTLACIVIYFIDLKLISKIAIVLSALLVAIVMNVFRVALTGVLAHFYDPKTATGFFHTFSGLIVFVIGLPILYGIGVLLFRIEKSLKDKKSS
jgi:exosortase